MNLTPRDFIPILMIVAALWGIFGIVRPHYSTISGLRLQQAEYENAMEKANEAVAKREILLGEYNSISAEQWERIRKMLPNEPKGVQLAQDIGKLAETFGIKLKKFGFGEEGGASAPVAVSSGSPFGEEGANSGFDIPTISALESRKLQLSFDFEATYPDAMRFLRELERNLELSDVRSLTLSRGGSGKQEAGAGSAGVYSIALEVDTYWVQ